METNATLCKEARKLGREFVVQVIGKVTERSNKNPRIPTGEIEIIAEKIIVLNPSEVPPFTIEDETDGGEELRMKYRYIDLRRNCMKKSLQLRHQIHLVYRYISIVISGRIQPVTILSFLNIPSKIPV